MDKDTPIILAAIQGIGLELADIFSHITYASAMLVILIGTIYLLWKITK